MDIGESSQSSVTGLPPTSTGTQPYATSQTNDSRNGAQNFDGKSLEQQEAESSRNTPFLNERHQQTLGSSSDSTIKRKTSPIPGNGPVEKRARRDSGDMDVDTLSECKSHLPMRGISTLTFFIPALRSKTPPHDVGFWFQQLALTKTEDRPQGPGDSKTDPRVITLLPGHKTEVLTFSLCGGTSSMSFSRYSCVPSIQKYITCWRQGEYQLCIRILQN